EREKLIEKLKDLSFVEKIYPSDANFVLVKTTNADAIYKFLVGEKIVVRNRNNVELCAGCLRVTVGTPPENERFFQSLKNYEKQ
ncbi:MAG: aminotransferase class I/II-fold pyridoxal phosphate-dependent enzyme, partial [Acidobacteria bacterium]|nr:aminotransferase class I/II-fold pyridoxal phosphate-dependent enzyme [Acidobacteriota bacterium]